MSRGVWIEVTNPYSPCYKDAFETAFKTEYQTFQASRSFANFLDIFKKELIGLDKKEGKPGDKLRCINIALLVSPPLLVDSKCEKLLNLIEFSRLPVGRKILLMELEGFGKNQDGYLLDCWKVAESLVFQTGFTHIGLANCTRHQLAHVLKYAEMQPEYLQFEASVHFPNSSMLALSQAANIIPIASAVFGKVSASLDPSTIMPIEEKIVNSIADIHHKSAGQILVKHALQRGLCPLIRSNSRTRIIAYSEVDDFELTKDEMHVLNTALVKR